MSAYVVVIALLAWRWPVAAAIVAATLLEDRWRGTGAAAACLRAWRGRLLKLRRHDRTRL